MGRRSFKAVILFIWRMLFGESDCLVLMDYSRSLCLLCNANKSKGHLCLINAHTHLLVVRANSSSMLVASCLCIDLLERSMNYLYLKMKVYNPYTVSVTTLNNSKKRGFSNWNTPCLSLVCQIDSPAPKLTPLFESILLLSGYSIKQRNVLKRSRTCTFCESIYWLHYLT